MLESKNLLPCRPQNKKPLMKAVFALLSEAKAFHQGTVTFPTSEQASVIFWGCP